MINRVVLVGRLTKDPELKKTTSDISVANFTLAVNRPYTNQAGEREADFINCQIWRKSAENVVKYISKGSLVGVEGRMQVRSYDDKNGERRYITEVVCENVQFLEPKGSNSGASSKEKQNYSEKPKKEQTPNAGNVESHDAAISEDDLPF